MRVRLDLVRASRMEIGLIERFFVCTILETFLFYARVLDRERLASADIALAIVLRIVEFLLNLFFE
jgi:hypothetical protein